MVRYVLICVLLIAAPLWADIFEDATWLLDPRMADQPTVDFLLREQVKPPEVSGPKNIHTLLRSEIVLKDTPTSAHLYITGDDYYKLRINGFPVVQGPEGGYYFSYPYYWLDIADYLEKGSNCLGAHIFYQGLRNRVWGSGDNRSGFILRLDVTYGDGTTERFRSNDGWRAFPLAAFPGEETIGYQTQFLENIDMRLLPVGWDTVGFDDSKWQAPATGRQDHVLVQQATPPLERYRKEPVEKKQLEEGIWFYDFGTEIVGHTRIRIKGKAGDTITVRHGEELESDGRVRYKIRASMTYEEKPVLSGNDEVIPFYDYRAFRYLEILDAPVEPEVWVEVRHHPFDDAASRFSSDDGQLAQIFEICKRGVQMGSQGGFLDCPTREKGQYLGDAVITGRSHLWLTNDPSLTRKALYDFYLSCQIHPGMMAVAPGHFMQEIAEYSLQYPFLLEAYYGRTGDRDFLEAMVDHVFPGLFAYYGSFANEAGLVEGLDKPEKWLLVDWPENLRDGYDYDFSKDKANTVLNGFYYGALRAAARLEQVLGRDGAAYTAKAEQVSVAFATQLADPKTGLYVDAPGSRHSSLHANAIPLAFGLTAGADPQKMLALIEEKGLHCGVYIASYVIEACFRAGNPELGYALLTNDTEHGWKEMLRAGATTCMEVWGPDQKWNTSWCHPWSSSPIYILAEHVLGLSPAAPGWTSVRFAPPRIDGLPAMTLTVPHPQGTMTARFDPASGYHLEVPEGVTVTIEVADGVKATSNAASIDPKSNQGGPDMGDEALSALNRYGWAEKVGQTLGVWIDVDKQTFHVIEGGKIRKTLPCATASAGTGSVSGSLQTPLGWHKVDEKFGADAPWGQVFRARRATKEIWKPGDDVVEDLVLTRVLWLDGMEPGVNKGTRSDGTLVDSKQRCIYIHGTNGEEKIGTPSSHGCVRLLNDDVIKVFEELPIGTPVLITEASAEEAS